MNNIARGGTELMADRVNSLSPELLSNFQIVHSRVRDWEVDKKKIYVLHDLHEDPEVRHLMKGGWKQFDKLVFVSHWQQQMYNLYLDVPYSAGTVIKNAIQPFEPHVKPTDKIRLMYYSTPHRGLEILYPVFCELYQEFGDRIELNVFSSFDLYGWDVRDKPYEPLFEKLKEHPAINYSKSVSNDKIREELKKSHILAYPSIWRETSCLVLIEAMCAGLICVHSSLGALPETSMGLTNMYGYDERIGTHAAKMHYELRESIIDAIEGILPEQPLTDIMNQHYSWEFRQYEWNELLTSLL